LTEGVREEIAVEHILT